MTAPLTIVVTGAPGEVAQSVARRLATHQQMHVVLVSRRRTKMRMPSNVEHIAGVDLADYVAVKRLFRHGSVRRAKRLALILGAGRFPNFPEAPQPLRPNHRVHIADPVIELSLQRRVQRRESGLRVICGNGGQREQPVQYHGQLARARHRQYPQ
jgi:NAD(P)-dependent dehydrogenase (short-subunit alcohol dehydrogenase family)